jgi:hypothetical protein
MYCRAAGSEIINWSSYESTEDQEVHAASMDIITYAEGGLEANDIPILSLPLEVSLCSLSLIDLLQIS